MRSPLAMTALLFLACQGACAGEADVAAVRSAVEKALPFIVARGEAWIQKRGCVSCHQVPSMLRSLDLAGTKGFKVPADHIEKTMEWSIRWQRWTNQGEKADRASAESSNVDTMTALLLSPVKRPSGPWPADFRKTLVRLQQSDGSWSPGGQLPLQDKSVREQKAVTTLWALLALSGDAESADAVVRARKFLQGGPDAETVERLALELVLACEEGRPHQAEVGRLVAAQSHEGGWPWKIGGKPDAFGTGLALQALARAGHPSGGEPVVRARVFLLSTQNQDGSWAVPGTRKKDAGRPKATSTDWGTAWAVIGLMSFLSDLPAR